MWRARNITNHQQLLRMLCLLWVVQVTKYVEREIMNHRQLVHPHIIQFKEVFLTTHHLGIAMEYAAGGWWCRGAGGQVVALGCAA